jgi:excisionase family DNA binding protein
VTARLAAAVAELVDALLDELRAETSTTISVPDRLLDIEAAAAALSCGRTLVYGEIARGALRSVKVGRRRLVPASAIAAYTEAVLTNGSPAEMTNRRPITPAGRRGDRHHDHDRSPAAS